MEQIKDIVGLLKITKNGVYELTNDIDCKGENLARILVQFNGQINGNGYKIFNFQLKYILKYDGQKLQCITGTAMNLFTMDKSLDQAWDTMVQKFFAQKEIAFEIL